MGLFDKLLKPRAPAPIDDATWRRTLARHPFLGRLDAVERTRLRNLCGAFIGRKAFSGAAGFEPDDEVIVSIAAQACLPVLYLGLDAYDDFSEIVVYPGEFHVERQIVDEDGVVHDASGALAGEAMPGGPVVLSWQDSATDGSDGVNVVVHEFAHKLDMANGGEADGVPILDARLHGGLDPQVWVETLDSAYGEFCDALDALEADFPPDLDPESEAGAQWYARLPLDDYAAEHPAEFFAVASETYFVAPDRLRDAFPALHAMLDRYYRPQVSRAALP